MGLIVPWVVLKSGPSGRSGVQGEFVFTYWRFEEEAHCDMSKLTFWYIFGIKMVGIFSNVQQKMFPLATIALNSFFSNQVKEIEELFQPGNN